MNQGARDTNREAWEREVLKKLDRIIELLERPYIEQEQFQKALLQAEREALTRRAL